ncbi:unnamed protein product [Spodoptera exigua]|nr:unnamed protein product [Spodoptera exigua]
MIIQQQQLEKTLKLEVSLREAVGMLMYLMVGTSSDIAFTTSTPAWFSVMSYPHIHHDKYPGYFLAQKVDRCLLGLRTLLATHGQQSYTLMKIWPSLVIGAILRGLEDSEEFLTTITSNLPHYLKIPLFYTSTTVTVTDPTHAMLKLELTGLWKTMGHPIVNMDNSTRSWFTKGTVLKRGLEPAAEQINNMFKKEFCRQYITKPIKMAQCGIFIKQVNNLV